MARQSFTAEQLARVAERIAAGETLRSAALGLHLKPASISIRAGRDPVLRQMLDDAMARRGPKPSSKRGRRDIAAVLRALENGGSLADACMVGGISMTTLHARRRQDPELDRKIHALLPGKKRFDADRKEIALTQIAQGRSLESVMEQTGGMHRSTFHRHLKIDPAFALAVHKALGGYGDVGGRVRPTKGKVKFEKLLAVLPTTRSLADACEVVGLTVPTFRGIIAQCPERRAAYFSAVAALPSEGRGKRALRNGHVDADLYAVVQDVAGGMSLADALRCHGVGYRMFWARRRRRPELEKALFDAGYRGTSLGRRLLNDRDQQAAVIARLEQGAPLYALGWFKLPCGDTVTQFAREVPEFRARLVVAMKLGSERRRGFPLARINEAVKAIASGVPIEHLPARGLPSRSLINYYRSKDPDLEARYQNAIRIARGDSRAGIVLTRDDLIKRVEGKLPKFLTADERRDCSSQAWLDALDGTLTAQNISVMVKRYIAAVMPLDRYAPVHLDQNGDVRSNNLD